MRQVKLVSSHRMSLSELVAAEEKLFVNSYAKIYTKYILQELDADQ